MSDSLVFTRSMNAFDRCCISAAHLWERASALCLLFVLLVPLAVLPSAGDLSSLERSAAAGNATAAWTLGVLLLQAPASQGTDLPISPSQRQRALDALEIAAGLGNASAALLIAQNHLFGDTPRKIPLVAIRWLERAAHLGNTEAAYLLGCLYKNQGFGIPQDFDQSRIWFQKAAPLGHGLAQYELGLSYEEGLGGLEMPKEARKWLELALANGVAQAGEIIGLHHLQGRGGLKPDLSQALQFYQNACASGTLDAPRILGALHENGLEGKIDRAKAWEGYLEAARRGNPLGFAALGSLAEDSGNSILASVYFRLAGDSQHPRFSPSPAVLHARSSAFRRLSPAGRAEVRLRRQLLKIAFQLIPACGPLQNAIFAFLER